MRADEPSTSEYADDLASTPSELESDSLLPASIQSEFESDDLLSFDKSTEEKWLVRKLDRRIMPIICFLYLFACRFVTDVRHRPR
jgi:hypothetical protein